MPTTYTNKGYNSTPYEIRLELIKEAKSLLEFECGQIQQEMDNIWMSEIEDYEKGNLARTQHPRPKQAKAPTVDEVLEVAARLNEFISNG